MSQSGAARLMERLQDFGGDTSAKAFEEALRVALKSSHMHTSRYNGHLGAAKDVLNRRVRLAYAVIGTSVPLFVAYGARIALGSTGSDLSRLLIPLAGIALCYVACRVECAHYRKNGESLMKAIAMEQEDDSTGVDGPAQLAAEQHMRGYGLSSVGAAATATWLVWVAIAAVEIYRM